MIRVGKESAFLILMTDKHQSEKEVPRKGTDENLTGKARSVMALHANASPNKSAQASELATHFRFPMRSHPDVP